MPTTCVESAQAWYRNRVVSRHSWRKQRATRPVPLPLDSEPWSLDLLEQNRTPSPLKLVDLDLPQVVSDEEVEAWLDSKVETVEHATQFGAFCIQILRLYIDWMPHVMAERCNPLDPDLARRELEHWVNTLNLECFTDGEKATPDRDSFPKA